MGKRIPRFKSSEEELRLWNRMGLEDVSSDQYEEVGVERPRQPLSTTFAIRLDSQTVARIRHLARLHGIGPTQLARAWVLERLRIEEVLTEPSSDLPLEIELAVRRRVAKEAFSTAVKAAKNALEEVLGGLSENRNAAAGMKNRPKQRAK